MPGQIYYADGIKLPATQAPSADANTLDDYEEVPWTPAITFGGAAVGVTYSGDTGGLCTKIGRQVSVSGFLNLTSKGGSVGNAAIAGLPFTNNAANGARVGVAIGLFNAITFANQLVGFIDPSQSAISLYEVTEAGAVSAITNANFADTSYIMFQATYFV